LLERVGRPGEAAASYRRAAELTRNQGERTTDLTRASSKPAEPAAVAAIATC
jgi:predicted RNA polymerase sigma factor